MLNKIYGILNNIIIRLVVYYLAWLLALGGIFHLFPQILIYVSQERERVQGRESFFEGQQGDLEKIKEGIATLVEGNITEVLLMVTFVDPARTIPVMVALAMAFWVTLPITWLYRWTRPRQQYSQSFAHTLLVIPIAISLVVFLVKDSIALAFSLAGIVAAVRFSHLTRRADGFRIYADGYRDRARGGYPTYFSSLPCIVGFCHYNPGGVEKQFWGAAGSPIWLANRPLWEMGFSRWRRCYYHRKPL